MIDLSSDSLFNWHQWFRQQKSAETEDEDENEAASVVQMVSIWK